MTNGKTLPIDEMKLVYIAGPMSGIQQFNFPAFDAARDAIEARGHLAVSPADLDRQAGFDPAKLPADFDWRQTPPEFDMKAARKRDIEAIEQCNAIVLLPGWEKSIGAQAEAAYARWCKLEVIEI